MEQNGVRLRAVVGKILKGGFFMERNHNNPFVVATYDSEVIPVNCDGVTKFRTSPYKIDGRECAFTFTFSSEKEARKKLREMVDSAIKSAKENKEALYSSCADAMHVPVEIIDDDTAAPAIISENPSIATERPVIVQENLISEKTPAIMAENTAVPQNVTSATALVPAGQNNNDNMGQQIYDSFLQAFSKIQGGVAPRIKKAAAERPTSYSIMEKLIKTIPFKLVGEVLYYYDVSLCHYKQLTEADAKRLIMAVCREDVEEWGTPSIVNFVYEFVTMNPDIVGDIHDTIHPDYLGFRNGILDLRTFTFLNPTPDIFITNIVDDYYEPGLVADCPRFNTFLSQCFNGIQPLISRAWEAFGYILTDDINAKCFIFLYGPGDSGKSLLIKLISGCFKEDAICPLMINQLGERFGIALANGKKLITCADLPKTPLSDSTVAMIKSLTGGDAISYEQKYKPMAVFINTAKLIFASNFPITLSSQDQAFYNRIVEIPFLNSVPRDRQIKNLFEILHEEKHAIIHNALYAYRNLRNRNYVFSGEEFIHQMESQPLAPTITEDEVVKRFFTERCCNADASSFVTTEELHSVYTDFCNANHYAVLAKEQFSKLFKKIYGDRFSSVKRALADGSRPRGYSGIALKR